MEPERTGAQPAVEVDGLVVDIGEPGSDRPVTRVGPINLSVARGSCLGIVGRSGAGKSTLALAMLGMLARDARVAGGAIRIGGESLFGMDRERLRQARGAKVAMIFQDPTGALNPVRRLDRLFADVIRAHASLDDGEVRRRSEAALRSARLDPAAVLQRYPHELSGGMRQRVVIALALANQPDVIVADEPTTALDPTIQLDILNLLGEIRRTNTLVVITHDLRVAHRLCDMVAVMDQGKVVEHGHCAQVLEEPEHDVTRMLLGYEFGAEYMTKVI